MAVWVCPQTLGLVLTLRALHRAPPVYNSPVRDLVSSDTSHFFLQPDLWLNFIGILLPLLPQEHTEKIKSNTSKVSLEMFGFFRRKIFFLGGGVFKFSSGEFNCRLNQLRWSIDRIGQAIWRKRIVKKEKFILKILPTISWYRYIYI